MNKLYFGDCLDILKKLNRENPSGFIDLIYIDPPFNSKRNYNILFEDADLKDTKAQKEAFADTWSNVSYKDTLEELKDIDLDLFSFLESLDKIRILKSAVSYLTTMAIRIYYMHQVLKNTGSFYLHCDQTMSHYLKILCDLIFGNENFRNEIVWHYRRWTGDAKAFMKMHDIILFYAKDKSKVKFNVQYTPYTEKSLERKQHYHTRIKGDDVYITKIDKNGVKENDVWQIQLLNSQSKERLGYPTQKPEILIKKIIEASSDKGDLVADLFCGCGTTIAVAQELERKWIGVDISHLAIGLVERKRLIEPYKGRLKGTYEIDGLPKDLDSARQLAAGTVRGRIKFEEWIIETMLGGIHNPQQGVNGSWDGHFTFQLGNKKEIVLIEVKSGNAGIKDMRSFIEGVNRQKAALGIFVAFKDNITKPMIINAKEEGFYKKDLFHTNYDKIQIISVEDLLDGKRVKMPTTVQTIFKTAREKKETFKHPDLFKKVG